MSVEAGTVIAGRYRVLRLLGEGGMGTVVLAEQTDLGRQVALKILSPELTNDPTTVERLRREAQAAAALSHPNVAQVYALEDHEGGIALAMEHVEGKSLREIVKVETRLSVERAVRIAKQMLQGLSAAHAASIVHRDVKPENVLVTVDDRGRDQVKLVDFGIAKKSGSSKLTEVGTVVGTPAYLAPEQCRGHDADARSDVWAVGIVLYELIAGERPFRADDTHQLLQVILQKSPALLSDELGVPEHVSAAVDRALRKDPRARFQSAKEMLAALDPPATEDAPSTKKERPKPVEKKETNDPEPKPASPPAPSPPPPPVAAAKSNAAWLAGLLVLAALVTVSLYFRYTDVAADGGDGGATVWSSAAVASSASASSNVDLADAGPIPSVIMTLGEDSDADIDPIADRAEDLARCLEHDRTCIVLTHQRGSITAVMPEEDDEKAAQCCVQALEGAMLDESAPSIIRVCITKTR